RAAQREAIPVACERELLGGFRMAPGGQEQAGEPVVGLGEPRLLADQAAERRLGTGGVVALAGDRLGHAATEVLALGAGSLGGQDRAVRAEAGVVARGGDQDRERALALEER